MPADHNQLISRGFITIMLGLILTSNVQAIGDIQYGDINGDGVYDNAAFEHEGLTFRVFDNDGDMHPGENIESCCDRDSDTWIISKDNGNIIVEFKKEEPRQSAYFFDDADEDGLLSYNITDEGVVISEGYPRVIITLRRESWVRDGTFTDLSISVNGEYEYVDSGNLSILNLKPGIPSKTPQAIIYLHKHQRGCEYTQYLDHEQPGGEDMLTFGCMNRNVSELWPVFGFPVVMDVGKSRIEGLRLFIPKPERGFLTYKTDIVPRREPYAGHMIHEYYWFDLLTSDNLSEGESQGIDLALRVDTINRRVWEDNKAHLRKVLYSWDDDNDGFSDYNVILIPSGQKIGVEMPVTIAKSLYFPTRPYNNLLDRIYSNFSGVTGFSVYEGAGNQSRKNFYINDLFAYYQYTPDTPHSLLPLSVDGRMEKTDNESFFYRSVIDGRVHLKYVTRGSWILNDFDTVTPRPSGQIRKDFLMFGFRENIDLVNYYDTDRDGYVDLWERFYYDTLDSERNIFERLFARENTLVLADTKIRFKKYLINQTTPELPLPVDYSGFLSFKRLFPKNLSNTGRTPAEIFYSLNNTIILRAEARFLNVKYASNTAVVEAYCDKNCVLTPASGVSRRIGRGKYMIVFDGDYTVFKLSSRIADYITLVDSFFNENPLHLLLLLLAITTSIFFLLWAEY